MKMKSVWGSIKESNWIFHECSEYKSSTFLRLLWLYQGLYSMRKRASELSGFVCWLYSKQNNIFFKFLKAIKKLLLIHISKAFVWYYIQRNTGPDWLKKTHTFGLLFQIEENHKAFRGVASCRTLRTNNEVYLLLQNIWKNYLPNYLKLNEK